jgi:hypothetical protein
VYVLEYKYRYIMDRHCRRAAWQPCGSDQWITIFGPQQRICRTSQWRLRESLSVTAALWLLKHSHFFPRLSIDINVRWRPTVPDSKALTLSRNSGIYRRGSETEKHIQYSVSQRNNATETAKRHKAMITPAHQVRIVGIGFFLSFRSSLRGCRPFQA